MVTGCKVRVYDAKGRPNRAHPTCNQPVVDHDLCEKHLADRVRLGGTR